MAGNPNVTIKSNVALPSSHDEASLVVGYSTKDVSKINGAALFNTYPHLFDKRLSDRTRFEIITPKQWREYIDDLKCAYCGKPGGRCNCRP
jgi:hypothetical protein